MTNKRIRLLELELENVEKRAAIEYTTLSHCWGTAEFTKTNLANYNDHVNGFDIFILPRTFRDAILLAKGLSVDYVWLEVLQASGSAHKWKGKPVFIRPSLQETHNGHLRMWQAKAGYRKPRPSAPLDTRGWVYQERLFSARTVSFYSSEIIWECRRERWCECGMILQDEHDAGFWERAESKYEPVQISRDWLYEADLELPMPRNQERMTIIVKWYKHVQDYTSRRLTREEDRLPAISGIASRTFESLIHNWKLECWEQSKTLQAPRYMGGLWLICRADGSLSLPGLTWSAGQYFLNKNFVCKIKRKHKFVAPSWSWASLVPVFTDDGDINARWPYFPSLNHSDSRDDDRLIALITGNYFDYNYSEHDPFFTIEEVTCTVEGDNPFGKISSGVLKVRGKLILARNVRSFYTEKGVLEYYSQTPDPFNSIIMDYQGEDLDADGWQPECARGNTYGLQITRDKYIEGDRRGVSRVALILLDIGRVNGNYAVGPEKKFMRIGRTVVYDHFRAGRSPFEGVREAVWLILYKMMIFVLHCYYKLIYIYISEFTTIYIIYMSFKFY
ncbi:0ffc0570-84c4-4782-a7ca-704dadf52cb4 [Sclerotinia trifoliorum]|uniref:0ffc0570-84c4-4782-a7ca-704dadf52cb4 n=1 Tax=Sclerotinia trifoliorum TaxID=28548 RepID=A0A8H2ZL74_9HELO|nr:0ffc0570-84c4-4782-a7ca-704dadf52cb4 [Sclerotinia trifoliorum]